MFLSYLTLFVALSLSLVAAWYSILGLAAIFAAAVIPIVIMGGFLELAKVVVTVWLHEYWHRCRLAMKIYLVPAVFMLMVITSMGIFGFLSKAHSDQSLVSGDVLAKLAIYDEKIKTAKENIEANRRVLKQMDEAVDQVMSRSSDEKGADRAVQIRRQQAKERARLMREIETEQRVIGDLNEQRAPIAAEVRKVEAEVGPIKYIAALIYGDNPDTNLLEAAVRWVIIMLVVVFDPLAIMMVLAATESLKWHRDDYAAAMAEVALQHKDTPKYEPDDDALTDEQIEQIVQSTPQSDTPPSAAPDLPYLKNWSWFKNSTPMVATPPETPPTLPLDSDIAAYNDERLVSKYDKESLAREEATDEDEDNPHVKVAMQQWKQQNPNDTLKNQRIRLARGEISELPWMALVPDNQPLEGNNSSFGTSFPAGPRKGDVFVRVDIMPNRLYKYNGDDWILVDKTISDSYTYNTAYIDHLIDKISSGEYDVELLSEQEREQVAERLEQKNQT
jgi:hypothetical protein